MSCTRAWAENILRALEPPPGRNVATAVERNVAPTSCICGSTRAICRHAIALPGEIPIVTPATETTRQAKILTVFRSVEQVSPLTDQLIAGKAAGNLQLTARALLTEFVRLDLALASLGKVSK